MILNASPSRPLRAHNGLSCSPQLMSKTPGASSEPPPSPDSQSSRDGWRPEPRHDRRPRVPARRLRAFQPAHPVELSKMARKRTQQRWSGLLTRIAKQVRATLGDAHANACYKDAFRNPILRCVGPPRGGVTAQFFLVDVTCARAYAPARTCHVGRRRRRRAAVPPALLGARRPGARPLRCCASVAAPCTDSAVPTARLRVYFIEIWARGGSTTTAGGGRRSRKTFERGLEDLHGERPSIITRSGKGWEGSVYPHLLRADSRTQGGGVVYYFSCL
jgi:hypothetical protein